MAGFECEFVEKPPKAVQFKCPICLLVLREPYQATCCGKSFCTECIQPVKADNQPCPTCNGIKNFNLFHNLGLQQSLYDFQVYCTQKSKGCEWTGELRELDNHLNSDPPADKSLKGCQYTLIKCPLSCPGCVVGLPRKDYKSHINDNIDKLVGLVVGQAARLVDLEAKIGEHGEKNKKLETKNKKLEKEVKEMKGQLSQSEGDKQYLEQRVMELEKKMKGQLSHSEGDKQDLEQQVADLLTKVTKLDEKFQGLEMKNRELENEVKLKQPVIVSSPQPGQPSSNQQPDTHVTGTYQPIGAKFTMTNFEEYRRDNDQWYSPHFYTHPNGYKMCLDVFPNGSGSGKGTHLSVYVCLMKGEYDDQLKWPFRGDITIKLVNQEEDKDHVVKTINFNSSIPEECCQRVMTKEQVGCGQGYGIFLPFIELQPKYLKNDCIKLCVKRVKLF